MNVYDLRRLFPTAPMDPAEEKKNKKATRLMKIVRNLESLNIETWKSDKAKQQIKMVSRINASCWLLIAASFLYKQVNIWYCWPLL